MKKIVFPLLAGLFVAAGTLFAACSQMPDKSVFEELSAEELSALVKADTSFAETYRWLRSFVTMADFSEEQKVQFKDITYRRLYRFMSRLDDEAYWKPRVEKWEREWAETMEKDLSGVDETVAYWADYKAHNSPGRFVKVEISRFLITHYEYFDGIDDAYFCFTVTPQQGAIDGLAFTFSYAPKEDDGFGDRETQDYTYDTPLAGPTECRFEIDFLEREMFDGLTVEEFLERYDVRIEITEVSKDGEDYSLDALGIPEAIVAFWEEDTPETRNAVAQLANPSYVGKGEYVSNRTDEEMRKYDAKCFEFLTQGMKQCLFKGLESMFDGLETILE